MKHIFRFLYFGIMTHFCFVLATAPTQMTLYCGAAIIMVDVLVTILNWYVKD